MPAKGVNQCIMIGNLGRDPVLRVTKTGASVCNFTIAINERHHVGGGGWSASVEWIPVVCFGKLATVAARFLSKGSMVYVVGRWHGRKYEMDDGQMRRVVEVIANDVRFLSSPSSESKDKAEIPAYGPQDGLPSDDDDDVSF